MGRRKEAALEEGGFVAGIEKLIATKDVGERTLYCFLAGTLRRRPEYAPLGYDRAQLYLSIRTKDDSLSLIHICVDEAIRIGAYRRDSV